MFDDYRIILSEVLLDLDNCDTGHRSLLNRMHIQDVLASKTRLTRQALRSNAFQRPIISSSEFQTQSMHVESFVTLEFGSDYLA